MSGPRGEGRGSSTFASPRPGPTPDLDGFPSPCPHPPHVRPQGPPSRLSGLSHAAAALQRPRPSPRPHPPRARRPRARARSPTPRPSRPALTTPGRRTPQTPRPSPPAPPLLAPHALSSPRPSLFFRRAPPRPRPDPCRARAPCPRPRTPPPPRRRPSLPRDTVRRRHAPPARRGRRSAWGLRAHRRYRALHHTHPQQWGGSAPRGITVFVCLGCPARLRPLAPPAGTRRRTGPAPSQEALGDSTELCALRPPPPRGAVQIPLGSPARTGPTPVSQARFGYLRCHGGAPLTLPPGPSPGPDQGVGPGSLDKPLQRLAVPRPRCSRQPRSAPPGPPGVASRPRRTPSPRPLGLTQTHPFPSTGVGSPETPSVPPSGPRRVGSGGCG